MWVLGNLEENEQKAFEVLEYDLHILGHLFCCLLAFCSFQVHLSPLLVKTAVLPKLVDTNTSL